MKKLIRADVLAPGDYAPVRDERRRRIIEIKKTRRVHVGPQVTLVFENRETMRSQVEEMCRAEALHDDGQIQAELDVYNHVLPDDGSLAATLFIEVTQEAAIGPTLSRLVGLQDHVLLIVAGTRIRAVFDPEQFATDKLAAVQYLTFPLDEASQRALRTPRTPVALAIDHPRYSHQATLDEATRATLGTDLE